MASFKDYFNTKLYETESTDIASVDSKLDLQKRISLKKIYEDLDSQKIKTIIRNNKIKIKNSRESSTSLIIIFYNIESIQTRLEEILTDLDVDYSIDLKLNLVKIYKTKL